LAVEKALQDDLGSARVEGAIAGLVATLLGGTWLASTEGLGGRDTAESLVDGMHGKVETFPEH
jgi:hypothetical protein